MAEVEVEDGEVEELVEGGGGDADVRLAMLVVVLAGVPGGVLEDTAVDGAAAPWDILAQNRKCVF